VHLSRAGRAALQSAAAIAVVISNSARGPIGHQGPGVHVHPRAAAWPGPSRRLSRRPPLGAPPRKFAMGGAGIGVPNRCAKRLISSG
jgi:hypothetical protein